MVPDLRRRHRNGTRLALVVAVAALSTACASVPADLQDSRLALDRGIFSGAKYSFDDSEPESVYSFWGTYRDPYLELLSEQPDALSVAESAKPYQYASLAVTAVAGIYVVSEFVAAVNSDDESLSGFVEADNHLVNAMLATLGMVVVNAALQIPIHDRLYDSARMYNASLEGPEEGSDALGSLFRSLPNSVMWNPVTRGVDVGWVLR